MKKGYSVFISIVMCFCVLFGLLACNNTTVSSGGKEQGGTGGQGVVEEQETAEPYNRTMQQDKHDLEIAGYTVEIMEGMMYGMFEPITAVESMQLVDLSTETEESFICIFYFSDEETLNANLSEYTRLKEYIIGPMPNYANERQILTISDSCFIIAVNEGIDLLPIVEHKENHKHHFSAWSVISPATTDCYQLEIRSCDSCKQVELSTGNTLAK